LLKLNNVTLKQGNKTILNKIGLSVAKNNIVCVMGPNGCGKSSLGKCILGCGEFNEIQGEIQFNDKIVNNLVTSDRAKLGIFLSFQEPVEIKGISLLKLLETIYSTKFHEYKAQTFFSVVQKSIKLLKIPEDMLQRDFNYQCSTGEKKLNEALQMLILCPELCILDEIDSGLDIDKTKTLIKAIQSLHKKGSTFLIFTHSLNVLQLLKPESVYILKAGKIVAHNSYSALLPILKEHGFEYFHA
jgi:Fe-S cluster assembly ATP-binding protein